MAKKTKQELIQQIDPVLQVKGWIIAGQPLEDMLAGIAAHFPQEDAWGLRQRFGRHESLRKIAPHLTPKVLPDTLVDLVKATPSPFTQTCLRNRTVDPVVAGSIPVGLACKDAVRRTGLLVRYAKTWGQSRVLPTVRKPGHRADAGMSEVRL